MERLLHYTWEHKLYMTVSPLMTTKGQSVTVLDPGLHNDNAGPDFFNAKIKLDDELWVGNVEIHTKSSDWHRHGHQQDENYNNVVLHVVEEADVEVYTASGKQLPQLVIKIPKYIEDNYACLLREDRYPPCWKIIPALPPIVVHQWLDHLCVERLENKTLRINDYVNRLGGDWEKAFFATLARSFGFGINSDTFEEWAFCLPLNACAKHRDNLFQLEVLFLGQAGLLEEELIPAYHLSKAHEEGYFQKLYTEYQYLRHKFLLAPMNGMHWNFLRLRPQNFPHIRIVQLAQLYHSQQVSLSAIMASTSLNDVRKLFSTQVTPYWRTHYVFGGESGPSDKALQQSSVDLIIINTVVPMLFAYGKHRMKEEMYQKGFDLLTQIKAENNRYTRIWAEIGLPVTSASDSQALIQLRTRYCDRKDCLRCRFGYYFLKKINN